MKNPQEKHPTAPTINRGRGQLEREAREGPEI